MKTAAGVLLAALGCLCLAGPVVAQTPAEYSDVPYSRRGADTCLTCHRDDATHAVFSTKHAAPADSRSPFGKGQLQCEACHGPGGNHARRVRSGEGRPPMPSFAGNSSKLVSEQNEMCLTCHEADAGFGWHGGPHDDNEIGCADCHSSHVARDPVLSTATQAEVCYACHQRQRTASVKPYTHPLRAGKMSCAGCHSPHGPTTEMQLVRQTVNDTCNQCHAEKRGPLLWEHAPAAEDCTLCHDPHGSNHPGMLKQRGPLLCQSCHSQAGHPSIAYSPGSLPPEAPGSKFLLGQNCLNCHPQVHGSNHPSGSRLMR